jgi:predicted acylesterase/phospholipase RssA
MEGKKLRPDQVHYLAFEGGGFKGIAYVGAIKVMEDLGILDKPGPPPADLHKKNEKIYGFSGTSVGAFVSFLLTLGHNSDSIRDIFIPGGKGPGLVDQVFEKKAQKNIFRSVSKNVYKEIHSNQVDPEFILHKTNSQIAKQQSLASNLPVSLLADSTAFYAAALGGPLLYNLIKSTDYKGLTKGGEPDFDFTNSPFGFVKDLGAAYVTEFGSLTLINILLKMYLKATLTGFLSSPSQNADQKFIDIITGDEFDNFFYNILFDCGAFTGTGLRKLVQGIFKIFLEKNLDKLCEIDNAYKNFKNKLANVKEEEKESIWESITNRVNFKQLYQLTGKQLSVVGANLTTRGSLYFDYKRTPEFPVIDAVTISMNFPIVFKPVIITGQEPDKMYGTELNGYWTDGGLLNNAPIHAFDKEDSTMVDEGVLCLRLTPGNPKFETIQSSKAAKILDDFLRHIKQSIKEKSNFTVFDFAADLFISSGAAPAEDGQFRIPQEKAQSLELYSFSVQNFTVAPKKEVMDIIIKWSQFFVNRYFDNDQKAGETLWDLAKDIVKVRPEPKKTEPMNLGSFTM